MRNVTIQNIDNTATPVFANIVDSGILITQVVFAGVAGVLTGDSAFTYDVLTSTLEVGGDLTVLGNLDVSHLIVDTIDGTSDSSGNCNVQVNCNIDANSGLSVSTKEVSSTYNVLPSDCIILCDATAGDFTVYLPSCINNRGKWYILKKIDVGANIITIDAHGAELIDHLGTYDLELEDEFVYLSSSGSKWQVISE